MERPDEVDQHLSALEALVLDRPVRSDEHENARKKLLKYKDECYRKIKELNDTLPYAEKFQYVHLMPREKAFFSWYDMYQMSNANPTPLKSKRFTQPGASEYGATSLLQILSLRFAGDLMRDGPISIYGFMAVRDDVDYLRNYVFNRSREHAHEIRPDSPKLPLISPVRGISMRFGVLVEYSIKVKNGDGNSEEDCEHIDGCFEYESWGWSILPCTARLKSRIFGPLGSVDIEYMFVKDAVEATVDVKIEHASEGYDLMAVTAYTSGFQKGIVLYDGSISSPLTPSSSSVVVLESSVVAVELGRELKLAFDISVGNEGNRTRRTKTDRLSFRSQKYKSTKGEVVVGRNFKLVAEVTWSTMGAPLPF